MLISRPRLITKLDQAQLCPLTLIAAPPGFGKTTLLRSWIPHNPHCVTWLALDAGDNDPARFWAYFIAALQTLNDQLGAEALLLLRVQQTQLAPWEAIVTILLNDLAAFQRDMACVLDDYHVIDNRAIHEAITYLIDHLPERVRLILTSRSDPPLPLARWRARNQLLEIRANDLRFTPDEAAQFLNQVMGLALPAEDVAVLETRTEGWIAGLQLAALSMQSHGDVAGFIAAFAGSNRYIIDYLAEEVLQRQPAPVQTFMLQTSILDRLTGPLCDAVTGQSQGQAQLERLERANLLLIPLDEERQWYRYHHLFGEALRSRLRQAQPDLVVELHRRASDWLQRHASPAEAVQHSLAAKDWEHAVALIEQVAQGLLNRGEYTTLRAWLEALPEDVKRARPRLCLASAATHILTHQLDDAERCLTDAEQAARAEPDILLGRTILSEAAAIRAGIAINRNELAQTIELAQQALSGLPAENLRLRGLVTFYMGLAYFWGRQDDEGGRLLTEAGRLSEAAGDINTALTATLNQAVVQHGQGHLHQAFALYQRILTLADAHRAGYMPIVGLTHANLGYSLYEWNDLETATLHLHIAIELSERVKAARALLFSQVFLSKVLAAQGQLNDALEILRKAEWLVQEHQLPVLYASEVAARRARMWLALGDLKAASDWADASGLNADDVLASLREVEYFALAQVLMARGDFDQALRLLARMRQTSEAVGRLDSVIQVLALEAVVLYGKGQTDQALLTLEHALVPAEPEGYIRTFVDLGETMRLLLQRLKDAPHGIQHSAPAQSAGHGQVVGIKLYVDTLLAAFPAQKELHSSSLTPHRTHAVGAGVLQPLVEPLSNRELEVLRLVAAGMSDRHIGEKLVVATGTVKRHLNSIYGKLGVHSRTQALLRAKELGLL